MAIPGSNVLLGGTKVSGYYGTVTSAEFITGDALASLVGLTAGTSQNSTTNWLKFSSDGKVIFSPMRAIRHTISWDQINAKNVVYGGKIVTIQGLQYKVRLWRGAENDPSKSTDTDMDAVRSEWNKLMLPIHVNAPSSWANPQYAGTTEDWGIDFTDSNLLTHAYYGNGYDTLCQDTDGTTTSGRMVSRGEFGVEYAGTNNKNYVAAKYGWRPVLELIAPPLPNLSSNINGVYREYSDGFVKIDGVWRQIDEIHTKIDGVWRKS